MEQRNKLLWTLVVALTGLTSWVAGQNSPANVIVPEVAAKVGYSANFSCESYGAPISTCLWERRGVGDRQTIFINFDQLNARDGQPSTTSGYSYTGSGLDRGSCGLIISVVKDEDNADWLCTLITGSKGIFRGTVHVNILKRPTAPQFATNIEQLTNLVDPESSGRRQELVSVTCGSANGQPPPKFKWFIGDRELTREDGLQNYLSSNVSGSAVTSQALNYRFTWRDNGQLLRCVLDHEGVTENDRLEQREVRQLISVKFIPKVEDYDNAVFVSSLGDSATLALNVSANPRPDINWDIQNELISPGSTSRNGRYKAISVEEVDAGIFECKLIIDPVEEEDLGKTYTLRASNSMGENKFDMRITSSSPSSAGLGAGGIIGLVLGIPALLIIIAVVLVYTRARGLLCFKGDEGTPSEKERMDGETPTVEEKEPATRRLSSRLSAIYENLVKKKDKTVASDEEAGKEKEKEKEATAETTTPGSDEKKPEDIVYAELDLTLNGGNGKPLVVVRCPDDKTEYAEIVGVIPPAVQNVDETKKDKTPTGSNSPSPKK